MNYKIDVKVNYTDRTETQIIKGEDINDVLQRVYNLSFADKKNLAKTTTDNLRKIIAFESELLIKSLLTPIQFSWDYLLSDFFTNHPSPINPELPVKPELLVIPTEPRKDAENYMPNIGVLDKIFKSRKQEILEGYKQRFDDDYQKWLKEKNRVEQINGLKLMEHNSTLNRLTIEYEEQLATWHKKKDDFLDWQKQLIDSYNNGEKEGVEKYFELILRNSNYENNFFDKKIFINYFIDTKILFIEYYLPDKKNLTKVKEIKYISSRDEFQEILFSETELNKKYDIMLYEITLRTINELFQSDEKNLIDQIVFNGLVDTINPSTGQNIKPCIISIGVTKEKFLSLNLKEIDPKECFKGLKGISASKLYMIIPIPPIMKFDKEDKRFIDSYGVAETIDNTTNIAAMNWEDFEHLIRELFEKEFSQNGGEVKVTQASRDGGVDAIAFDPDPIRGGKIVIQAKRYTNVVSVAAVRDLYGTVVNEGATKGILVTTSNYGSDSYEFAKNKPITLLNGSNLLHLLEKHGHRAKIDIPEAKRLFLENEKGNK